MPNIIARNLGPRLDIHKTSVVSDDAVNALGRINQVLALGQETKRVKADPPLQRGEVSRVLVFLMIAITDRHVKEQVRKTLVLAPKEMAESVVFICQNILDEARIDCESTALHNVLQVEDGVDVVKVETMFNARLNVLAGEFGQIKEEDRVLNAELVEHACDAVLVTSGNADVVKY